jgi:hypothetical protein
MHALEQSKFWLVDVARRKPLASLLLSLNLGLRCNAFVSYLLASSVPDLASAAQRFLNSVNNANDSCNVLA